MALKEYITIIFQNGLKIIINYFHPLTIPSYKCLEELELYNYERIYKSYSVRTKKELMYATGIWNIDATYYDFYPSFTEYIKANPCKVASHIKWLKDERERNT